MPVDISTETVIRCPRERVAAFAGDPSNATVWYANIKAVAWESEPPLRIGSRVAFTASFMGRKLTYTYEVNDLVPGLRLVMSTTQGPFPMETTYTWEDVADGTRMTLRNRGEPSGFSAIAAPMMKSAMRRANKKDLEKLKSLLESEVA